MTSGSTPKIAEEVDQLYASIITAGTYKAESIRVCRGRQSDREHAARSKHCAHERTGDDLQQDGDRHRCGSESSRHKMEFPAVPAWVGRRALHRGGPILPDPQGRGDRLSPTDHPGRAAYK